MRRRSGRSTTLRTENSSSPSCFKDTYRQFIFDHSVSFCQGPQEFLKLDSPFPNSFHSSFYFSHCSACWKINLLLHLTTKGPNETLQNELVPQYISATGVTILYNFEPQKCKMTDILPSRCAGLTLYFIALPQVLTHQNHLQGDTIIEPKCFCKVLHHKIHAITIKSVLWKSVQDVFKYVQFLNFPVVYSLLFLLIIV